MGKKSENLLPKETSDVQPEEQKIPYLNQLQNTYFLLRHGQTDFNKFGLIPGSINVPLNAVGISQAERVKLSVLPDFIFTSTLSRATDTALIVAHRHELLSKLHFDQRLVEKNGGWAEGKSIEQTKAQFPAVWDSWNQQNKEDIARKNKFPDGESDVDVAMRLSMLVSEIEDSISEMVILLVTHGNVMRVMRLLAGFEKDKVYGNHAIPNCSLELYVRSSSRQ